MSKYEIDLLLKRKMFRKKVLEKLIPIIKREINLLVGTFLPYLDDDQIEQFAESVKKDIEQRITGE